MALFGLAHSVGMPHHVTQRGHRREAVFVDDADRRLCPLLWQVPWSGRPSTSLRPSRSTWLTASKPGHDGAANVGLGLVPIRPDSPCSPTTFGFPH